MFNDQKLVFDFAYDEYMIKKFCHYTSSHFVRFFADNRQNNRPFDLHITNANSDGYCMQHLEALVPNLYGNDCPVDVHRECFTDLYPHKNLVYLTPYSPQVLTEYNPDDIYVIGAIVDYGYHGSVTMAKAKKMGIRTAYPPISRYMNWGARAKNLPINIIGNILLDFKNTTEWTKALEHIPQRLRRQPRQERPNLHKIIDKITDPRGEMPRNSWDMVRDQTRLLDNAKAKGLPNPFKRQPEIDGDTQKPQKKLNPFK